MKNKKIILIGGARPNFMKIAPLIKILDKNNIFKYKLINTGQHFHKEMAENFFYEFGIKPDYNLVPDRTSVVSQLTDIMNKIELIVSREYPDVIIVVGDVNSTLAGALVANKMRIKLAHIEAGLRSHNYFMPEEYNRIITDRLSDFLFVTDEGAVANLAKEGIVKNVYLVGNIMIDNICLFPTQNKPLNEKFYFCTLHRAENIDNEKVFRQILGALEVISRDQKIYFPIHPRAKKMAKKYGLYERMKKIFYIMEPLSYKESVFYQKNAKLILTDSGGVQEEATFLGTPCITLRTETERPITIERGTNILGGVLKETILASYNLAFIKKEKKSIPLWDGKTAERIISILEKIETIK